MSLKEKFKRGWDQYEAMKAKTAAGDRGAMADKAKLRVELKQMQREAARDGIILEPDADKHGRYTGSVTAEETDTKRSLQQEYVRKFDGEKTVNVGGKEQTLRQYHKDRLLG